MDIVWQAEDSLREKKVENDLKDWPKTLVAFANSVAPGDTATIFIGEKDDGFMVNVRLHSTRPELDCVSV
jgi:predicted HTH transcriptional regulator